MHARRTFAGPSARAHILSYIFENYPLCVGHDINDLGFFPSRGTLGPSAGQEYGTECNSDAILTPLVYITTYNKFSVFFLTLGTFFTRVVTYARVRRTP